MKFNSTLCFLIITIFAVVSTSVTAQIDGGSDDTSSSSGGMSAGGGISMMQQWPKCLLECAQKASMSKKVGCKGLADIKCICPKQKQLFAKTMKCAKKSKDAQCKAFIKDKQKASAGKKTFEGLCKQAQQGKNDKKGNSTAVTNSFKHPTIPGSNANEVGGGTQTSTGPNTLQNTNSQTNNQNHNNNLPSGAAFPPNSPESGVRVDQQYHPNHSPSSFSINNNNKIKGSIIIIMISAFFASVITLL